MSNPVGRPAKLTGAEKREVFSRLDTQAKFALELEMKMERQLSYLYGYIQELRQEINQLKNPTA
jgi:hypothetical protein